MTNAWLHRREALRISPVSSQTHYPQMRRGVRLFIQPLAACARSKKMRSTARPKPALNLCQGLARLAGLIGQLKPRGQLSLGVT